MAALLVALRSGGRQISQQLRKVGELMQIVELHALASRRRRHPVQALYGWPRPP